MNDKTVCILVTVPNKNCITENLLVFDSLRTGFPTSLVEVWDNSNDELVRTQLEELCRKDPLHQMTYSPSFQKWHHADWIEMVVGTHDGPVVILDSDVILYESCEDMDFPTLIAGRFVPVIWNEFAGAISYERLHTSFLVIKDCKELREHLADAYPFVNTPYGPYTPLSPYHPCVQFYGGYPMFWDCCSTMFHMIGGSCFTENELKRYAHVNSSAFQDVMMERVRDKKSFALQHEKARNKDVEWFRGFHKAEERYYMEMNQKAMWMMEQRRKPATNHEESRIIRPL